MLSVSFVVGQQAATAVFLWRGYYPMLTPLSIWVIYISHTILFMEIKG